jgi:NADH dehydrogenase FAD-containing subunit
LTRRGAPGDRDAALGEQGALNFVIVVGGATGTEIAGGLVVMIPFNDHGRM